MTRKATKHSPSSHWVLLISACIASGIIWYCLMVSISLGIHLYFQTLEGEAYRVYSVLAPIGEIAIFYFAAFLTYFFAAYAFKKLKVEAPRATAVALTMSFVFALSLGGVFLTLFYRGGGATAMLLLGAGILGSAVVYGGVLRRLKHVMTRRWFVVTVVALPALVFAVAIAAEFLIYR